MLPQALTTVGRPIHHRRGAQARHIQAGERKWQSLHQCLEHTAAMSLLSLEFQAILYNCLYSHFGFPEIIKKYALLVYFWEPSGPSWARMRMNTKVCLALPSVKPSLPRGLLWGEPPNVPKNHQCFFDKFLYLSFSYS